MTDKTNPFLAHLCVVPSDDPKKILVKVFDDGAVPDNSLESISMSVFLAEEIMGVLRKLYRMTDDTIASYMQENIKNYVKSYKHVEKHYKFTEPSLEDKKTFRTVRGRRIIS